MALVSLNLPLAFGWCQSLHVFPSESLGAVSLLHGFLPLSPGSFLASFKWIDRL